MHEASIVQSILEISERECLRAGGGRIEVIRIRVGAASGVFVDSLRFAFEALREGTLAEGASLIIEEPPLGGFCRNCNRDFTVDGPYATECPLCGGADFSITTGHELDVIDLEVQ